ncbi:MAG: hypothetical protein J6125_01600 [Clostridia bacterium]|nr:hypothetical protein [Clostridia bacterium]
MVINRKPPATLRRTALEVKSYRLLKKVIPAVMGVILAVLTTVFVVAMLYDHYGSFTVSINKFDNINFALSLSEAPDFKDVTTRLNSKASKDITNIDGSTLPGDLDSINGSHNGANYVAYTFYCRNTGKEACSYEYQLYIATKTQDIDKAVRVRLYVDGVATDYARVGSDGQPEIDYAHPDRDENGMIKIPVTYSLYTTPFLTESVICRDTIDNLVPGGETRFTVVIWLEGEDPDCVDTILGGQFKVDMQINIIGIEA